VGTGFLSENAQRKNPALHHADFAMAGIAGMSRLGDPSEPWSGLRSVRFFSSVVTFEKAVENGAVLQI
jgi:hypothetical protein